MARNTYMHSIIDGVRWTRTVALLVALSIPLLSPAAWTGSDQEFVDRVESNNWEFFRHNQGGPFNLFRQLGSLRRAVQL